MRITVREASRSKYLPDDYGYWFVHLEFCPLDWQMPLGTIEDAFALGFCDRLLNHWKDFIESLGFSPCWIQTFMDGFQAGFQTQEEAEELATKLKSLPCNL